MCPKMEVLYVPIGKCLSVMCVCVQPVSMLKMLRNWTENGLKSSQWKKKKTLRKPGELLLKQIDNERVSHLCSASEVAGILGHKD